MIYIKCILIIFLLFVWICDGLAQTGTDADFRSLQLENIAEKNDVVTEDDAYEMELDQFRKTPLNLNAATEEDFISMHMLNILQIRNFIDYRKLLGPLLNVYEMQAIPGWDIGSIQRLLPYVSVGTDESVYTAVKKRWTGGNAQILLRAGQVIENAKGYLKPAGSAVSYYEGSAQRIFMRYNYNYKQLLSYGFTGDKDAGEPFFKGAQRYGFDFYSFHFYMQRVGIIRALAIGDFTVNLGQGLIQWQSFSFTKTGQAMFIKREAEPIRAYRSAGEFNFHRGFGVTLQKGHWQSSVFISSQKISTNRETDTLGREDIFSSFQNSGYHRTPAEIEDRNNNRQLSFGGNIRYSGKQFLTGFNFIHFRFDRPFQKQDEPYNIYSLKGRRLTNYSFDYHYTRGNIHLFGELALDSWQHIAVVQGAMLSLSENMDMGFLYRNISPAFQSLYSDAFTENSVPNNERGFYTAVSFKPSKYVQADIFYDLFSFPWLKYGVSGPSGGRDLLARLNYQPDKMWRLTLLYKNERKTTDAATLNSATHILRVPVKQRWRIESAYTISRLLSFNSRVEMVSIKESGLSVRNGFLGMTGFAFRNKVITGNMAAVVFETDDYDSRMYMYASDMLYNYSLPVFYGKGIHYYINVQKDLTRMIRKAGKRLRVSAWLRWSQTFYPGVVSVGSGLDEINGNRKSEIKAQILLQWQ